MPNLQYILIRTKFPSGRRYQLFGDIRSTVKKNGWAKTIQMLKAERSLGAEFYLGLGVVDDLPQPGQPPSCVISLMKTLGRSLTASDLSTYPLKEDEIPRAFMHDCDWEDFLEPIKFW